MLDLGATAAAKYNYNLLNTGVLVYYGALLVLFIMSYFIAFINDGVLFCAVAVYTSEQHAADWKPALRMYRGMFLVILFVFLLGINTYGWRASGVNHVLIFELDPRNHLTHQQFMEVRNGVMMILMMTMKIMILMMLVVVMMMMKITRMMRMTIIMVVRRGEGG